MLGDSRKLRENRRVGRGGSIGGGVDVEHHVLCSGDERVVVATVHCGEDPQPPGIVRHQLHRDVQPVAGARMDRRRLP